MVERGAEGMEPEGLGATHVWYHMKAEFCEGNRKVLTMPDIKRRLVVSVNIQSMGACGTPISKCRLSHEGESK
jgi:hypothetical protein